MDEEKRVISKAQRRKEKKGVEVITQAQKDVARERVRVLRKEMRMLKSNGYRRKVRKLAAEKREREIDTEEEEVVFKNTERPRQKRRLESSQQVSQVNPLSLNPIAVNPLSKPSN